MIWVATGRIIAAVADEHSIWNFTFEVLVAKPVNRHSIATKSAPVNFNSWVFGFDFSSIADPATVLQFTEAF